MLITQEGITHYQKTEQMWEDGDYLISWRGFVFVLGIAAGMDSVMTFAEEVRASGLITAIKLLKGHFFMTVCDKQAGVFYSFIDNSGAFEAFHTDSAISTSFLALARYSGFGKERVSKEAIVEFINFGNIYDNRTLLDGICKIDSNEIIVFCSHKKSIVSKQLASIDTPCPDVDVMDFFRRFCQSIRHLKISADLTGGVDSRLVCVLLDHYGVPFEAAISGRAGIRDVEIPVEIARVLDHRLYVTEPCVERLEQMVPELFVWCDGMNDLFKHYRTLPHHQSRRDRGIELVISGIGGEFLKENMWVQDFPFYARKKANIRRFLRMRMLQIKCKSSYFAGEFRAINDTFENGVVDKLGRYRMDTNTKTYDSIYYHFRMKTVASTFIASTNHLFGCYSPFLEYDLVRCGFHLKRRVRFFNRYHRELITRLNPQVARIPTAEGGISASAETLEMLKDIGKYIRNRCRRVTKVVGRKLLSKTYLQESPEHPELFRKMRTLGVTEEAVERLKREGVLDPRLEVNDILDAHLGNIVTFAVFLGYLEGREAGDVRGEDRTENNQAVVTV